MGALPTPFLGCTLVSIWRIAVSSRHHQSLRNTFQKNKLHSQLPPRKCTNPNPENLGMRSTVLLPISNFEYLCWSMLMKFSIWFEFPKLPGLTAFLHKFSISIHQPLTLNAIGSTGNPPIPPVTVVPDPSASGGLHGTLDFDIQQEVHDFIQLQQDLLDQFLWPQKINPTGR